MEELLLPLFFALIFYWVTFLILIHRHKNMKQIIIINIFIQAIYLGFFFYHLYYIIYQPSTHGDGLAGTALVMFLGFILFIHRIINMIQGIIAFMESRGKIHKN